MKKFILLLSLGLFSFSIFAEDTEANAKLPSIKPENIKAFNNFIHGIITENKSNFLISDNSYVKGRDLQTVEDQLVRVKAIVIEPEDVIENKSSILVDPESRDLHGNVFISIDRDDDIFLNISKGNKIDLICKEDSKDIIPIVKNCVLLIDYADNIHKLLKADIMKYITDSTLPKSKESIKVLILYKVSEPYIEKDCLISEKACIDSLKRIVQDNNLSLVAKEKGRMLFEAYKIPI